MGKRTLKNIAVIVLVLSIMALAIFLTISPLSADGGTCCPHSGSICVVGTIVIFGAYYLPSGPCPPPQQD